MHRIDNQLCLVQVTGNLTLKEVSPFRNYVMPLLIDPQFKGLVLDLGNSSLIDSSGLAILTVMATKLKPFQIPMILIHVSETVKDIFFQIGLNHLIDIEESEDSARKRLFS